MQHIEEAGIHSGDSTCFIPPQNVSKKVLAQVEDWTRKIGIQLGVKGCFNIQYAIRGEILYVLEVNPRASRTVPFVAKAVGQPIAKIAARLMAGEKLADFGLDLRRPSHVAVKEAVFPFARFPGVDILLGPEMKSTGEVMGLDV